MDPALLGTASAFGLAASAGLNTTLPLLCVGLLARFGFITLGAPYDALQSTLALGVLALLATLEFAGDKIPAVDSVVQVIQWPVSAAAGALLFASQTSVITQISPELALIVGLLTATGIHGARTAARPVITGTTLGTGNTAVSLAEDGYALTLAGTAALFPGLALVLLVVLVIAAGGALFLAVSGGRRLRRLAARS